MAFTSQTGTIANLQNSLKRIYDPAFFESMQNLNVPFYKSMMEAKNIEADGEGYFWPFYLATPQNMGSPAESGDLPPIKQRLEIQGRVRPVQMVNSFQISFIMAAIGTQRGTFGKSEIKRQMWETTTDITKHMNRLMSGSHGSGRIAQVNANTSASTSFTAKAPLKAWLIRKKMLIDVYTADTAGSISSSGNATQIEVTDVNYSTGVVTMGTALSLSANEHVYVYPDYNNAPNGLAGLIDDGTNLTTIHNQSRSTYSDLKAYVSSNSGVGRPITEEMMIDMHANILQLSGEEVDTFCANRGQIRQYLRNVIPQRRYNLDGKGVPSYDTGYKTEDLTLFFGGKPAKLVPMEDVSPSLIYAYQKRLLRKCESEKLDWYRHGGPEGGILAQGIGSSGRKTTHEACVYVVFNIMNQKPNACGVIRDLLDPQMNGDASE